MLISNHGPNFKTITTIMFCTRLETCLFLLISASIGHHRTCFLSWFVRSGVSCWLFQILIQNRSNASILNVLVFLGELIQASPTFRRSPRSPALFSLVWNPPLEWQNRCLLGVSVTCVLASSYITSPADHSSMSLSCKLHVTLCLWVTKMSYICPLIHVSRYPWSLEASC